MLNQSLLAFVAFASLSLANGFNCLTGCWSFGEKSDRSVNLPGDQGWGGWPCAD